jgi:SWI/SNF-related matrix-associated actin-dependent regulator 1 of chromatin subfamily A
MHCKYCNKEQEIIEESKFTSLVTLACKHTVTRELSTPSNDAAPIHEAHAAELIPVTTEIQEITKKEPLLVSSDGRVPYSFQEEGINFVKEAFFCALIADEMGLGKTIQALGVLKLFSKVTLPACIVVKSSLKLQWFGEVIRWCGIKGFIPQIITDGKTPPVPGFNICIVSRDVLRKFTTEHIEEVRNKYGMDTEVKTYTNPFYEFPFKTIIIDEAQGIANIKSNRTQEIYRLCEGKQVIALSGTPFKNNILEYFPILHLLKPDLFPSIDHFTKNYVKYKWVNGVWKAVGLKNPEFFKEMTKDFIIRRERSEVDIEFPTLNRVFQHVDWDTEKLKREYEKAEYELVQEYESRAASKNPQEILGIMAVVRHIVGLNKVKPTVELVEEFLLSNERKIVVFTHHADVMDLIHKLLTITCLDGNFDLPLRFHSGLSSDERDKVIKQFRDGPSRILVASTLAAGEGLNLQFCSDCILVERQWNPANEEQAEGRFIRIGATSNKVNAVYMVVSGTIDEWFTELVEEKRRMFKATMSGSEVMEMGSLLEELMKIVVSKGRKNTVRGF